MHDSFCRDRGLSPFGSELDLPEDKIEPEVVENILREAGVKFMAQMLGCIQFIRDARNDKELMMRIDIVSYIFRHPDICRLSFTQLGRKHNKTRAAISAQTQNFLRSSGLPPSLAQKSEDASASYRKARVSKLA